MGALLWPLFAAACEAMTGEDREMAERAFEAVGKRQGMMNIERSWEIVKEVWRRADWADVVAGLSVERPGAASLAQGCGAKEEMWREVSKEMGVSIVFG